MILNPAGPKVPWSAELGGNLVIENIGKLLAERAGFEPAVGVTLRRFSKPLPSATRPPLRANFFQWFQLLIGKQSRLPQGQVVAGLLIDYLLGNPSNEQRTNDSRHRKGHINP